MSILLFWDQISARSRLGNWLDIGPSPSCYPSSLPPLPAVVVALLAMVFGPG